MSAFDLIVRGGRVVTAAGVSRADVGVSDGVIAAVEPELPGAATEIDATGLHVFPGGLDPHVHFNEPGRTHWEGLATGSAALAAGGFTAFFDMPLNSTPPTIDGAGFDAKHEAARRNSCLDYGLWGGLVPGNADRLEELAERGVIGFKAFMSNSGIEDFQHADDATLYDGMAICAKLGRLVAVHAENDALTARANGPTARDFMDSRPLIAELEAIARAIAFAEDTGCALHIVHVSSGRGVALVTEARARGVDVTCETCPHYLFLTPADVERLGAVAKCAPPVRERPGLWERLAEIQMVTSDHSPSSPDLKQGSFGDAWGGIAGCQTTLTLLAGECEPPALARLTSTGAAERFHMPHKGRIEPGADADLALVDLAADHTLQAQDLLYRHPISPWIGRRLRARVVRTLLRGSDPAPGAGRLLTPATERIPHMSATEVGTLLNITAGPYTFTGALERERAPKTVAAFERILPFHSKIIHVRWSGESAWIPLGDLDIGLDTKPENATSFPAPGQVLWYPGGISETELLFPYGGTRFASIVGQLAGNHFLTIVEGIDQLRPLGEHVLWKGALDIVFDRADA